MELTLQPVEGPELDRLTFAIADKEILLGRHDACDVVLQSRYVSRFHAALNHDKDAWYITDTDSHDGVYLDSIKLEPSEAVRLHDGAILGIGPWVFLVGGAGMAPYFNDEIGLQAIADDTLPTNASLLLELNHVESVKRESAWYTFVQRYEQVIRAVSIRFGISSHDIEDVMQDVLLGLFRTGNVGYDRSKGKFRSYLKAATKNAIIARWNNRAQEKLGLPEDVVETFDSHWDCRWREHVLNLALHSVQHMVDPMQYEAFELFGRRGVPALKVAKMLGMSAANVRQSKCRIMLLVQSEIARLDDVQ